MKRVTRKVRAFRRKTQALHYVFGSEQHAIDAAAAAKLRQVRVEVVEIIDPGARTPFGGSHEMALKVAGNAVRSPYPVEGGGEERGGFSLVENPDDYVDRLVELGKPVRVERPKKGRKPKKDGTLTLDTYKVDEPLKDAYFSLPPWVSRYLSRTLSLAEDAAADPETMAELVEWVRAVAFEGAKAAAAELERRTGYEVEGIALHPDGETAFGFHLQFLTARDGLLLGRSADGTRGRKGLRLAGDVNLGLSRFDAMDPIPGAWQKKVREGDYDDVAMDGPLQAAVRRMIAEKFGAAALKTLDGLARAYVRDWKKGSAARAREEKLKAKITELKAENSDMRARIDKLEGILRRMGHTFTPGPDAPDVT